MKMSEHEKIIMGWRLRWISKLQGILMQLLIKSLH